MKVILGPGCDLEWLRSLTPPQHSRLADIYRQGRHLRDGTNHGSDERWRQAGVKTRDRCGYPQRTSRGDRGAHEAIVIRRTDYGYQTIGVRRTTGWEIDIATGEVTERTEVWAPAWVWYVGDGVSASWEEGARRRSHA